MALRVSAIGKVYHPEHFTCSSCSSRLSTDCFFIGEGVLYCKSCEESRSARTRSILCSPRGVSLNSNQTYVTSGRIRCGICSNEVLPQRIVSVEGRPLCLECSSRTAPSVHPSPQIFTQQRTSLPRAGGTIYSDSIWHCCGCQQMITDNSCIRAVEKYWHKQCFLCHECRAPLPSNLFFIKNGLPHCAEHK